MLKCDKCGSLLTLIRVHNKRAFCDNCKAWLSWVIYSEERTDIRYCIECSINHAKHSKPTH